MRMHVRLAVVLCLAGTLFPGAKGDVTVAQVFGNGMVLQRDRALPVWGTADAGEKITVAFAGQEKKTVADASGAWKTTLEPIATSAEGREFRVTGNNAIVFTNVLVGDVWVCSGQSNMEWPLGKCNAQQDIDDADLPTLRQIKIGSLIAESPRTAWPKTPSWTVCSPSTAGQFTAVGFYFARALQRKTSVPIGLVNVSWGGTRIEPWTPVEGLTLLDDAPAVRDGMVQTVETGRKTVLSRLNTLETWLAQARAAAIAGESLPPAPPLPATPNSQPHVLWNAMVSPLVPYGIAGTLWYQGESNGGERDEYFHKMRALIGSWRTAWGQGDFPFYYVQLANFGTENTQPTGGDGWTHCRVAQTKALSIPNTGMAVIIDIGETGNIHPKNKVDVGERLARWALRDIHGQKELEVLGPLFRDMTVEGSAIRIRFDHLGGGLIVGKKDGPNPVAEVKDGTLAHFAIAGADKKWVWANAVIDGETVLVSHKDVAEPVAVRYAFSQNPLGANLYNRAGLPANPFRTDAW